MARPAEQGGISREHLVSVAAELFAHRGYRATTLDELAAEVGIKKASLYHYIESKEELLTAIYDRILDRITSVVGPIASLRLPADERLRRMVHAHLGVVASERDMLAVIFREEAELPEPSRRSIRRRKRAYERLFERVVEDGERKGLLRPGDGRLFVLALLGMCNWLYQWYRPGRFDVDEIAGVFTKVLESGWLAGGDARREAHPRPTSIGEALAPISETIEQLREQAAELESRLDEAGHRLEDGLATQS